MCKSHCWEAIRSNYSHACCRWRTQKVAYTPPPHLEPREFIDGKNSLPPIAAPIKRPTYGGHYSYDAMHAGQRDTPRGLRQARKNHLIPAQVVDTYSPVTGSMRFDADGEPLYRVSSACHKVRHQQWEPQLRSSVC